MSELLQDPYTRAEIAAMFEIKPASVPRNIKALSLVKSHVFTEPTVSRKKMEVWFVVAKAADLPMDMPIMPEPRSMLPIYWGGGG